MYVVKFSRRRDRHTSKMMTLAANGLTVEFESSGRPSRAMSRHRHSDRIHTNVHWESNGQINYYASQSIVSTGVFAGMVVQGRLAYIVMLRKFPALTFGSKIMILSYADSGRIACMC
jgi:hypothetical protein